MGVNEACILVYVAAGPGGARTLREIGRFVDELDRSRANHWEAGRPDPVTWPALRPTGVTTGATESIPLRDALARVAGRGLLARVVSSSPELGPGGALRGAVVTLPVLEPGRTVARARRWADQERVHDALDALDGSFWDLTDAERAAAERALRACLPRQPAWSASASGLRRTGS